MSTCLSKCLSFNAFYCLILVQFVRVVFSCLVADVVAVSMGFWEMVHVCATLHLMAQLVRGVLIIALIHVQVYNNDLKSRLFSLAVVDP